MGVAQGFEAGEVRGGGLALEGKQVGGGRIAGGHAGLGGGEQERGDQHERAVELLPNLACSRPSPESSQFAS